MGQEHSLPVRDRDEPVCPVCHGKGYCYTRIIARAPKGVYAVKSRRPSVKLVQCMECKTAST
jgi:hypothetical protein